MSHHTRKDSQERCVQTLDEFFTRNYNKFTGYCKMKWNGSGEDVCCAKTRKPVEAGPAENRSQ